MGFFRKKKKEQRVSAPIQSMQTYGRVENSATTISPQTGARTNYSISKVYSRVALEIAGSVEQPSVDEYRPRSRQSNHSNRSEKLKLRLKKSLGMLFSDNNISNTHWPTSQPPMTEITSQRLSISSSSASNLSLGSPRLGDQEDDAVPWPEEQPNRIVSDVYFNLPIDAPPVPATSLPERLAFLEPSKSRLSMSYQSSGQSIFPSTTQDQPLSPKDMRPPTLFERRNPGCRPSQLTLPVTNISTSYKPGPKSTRASFASSHDTSTSFPSNSRGRTSSVPSANLDAELSTPATSLFSGDGPDRKPSPFECTLNQHERALAEMGRQQPEGQQSPGSELRTQDERKIGNIRLADVIRVLFGGKGRIGVDKECRKYLAKHREPRILELTITVGLPMLTAYHDDYPHGKFYVVCREKFPEDLDPKAQESPLEEVHSGVTSFTHLNFPDNFFDVITAGSLQYILTKDKWVPVLAECLRILKPGGWLDILIPEPILLADGLMTKAYESQLLDCLKSKNVYPRPGLLLPSLMRTVGFKNITRCQVLLPIFWRDSTETPITIREGRTGETSTMTISEMGDRMSTLFLGFWEEILGEWDEDIHDLRTRNRLRRKEAEKSKSYASVVKLWARKKR